jgi:putative ABC transport system permease protein
VTPPSSPEHPDPRPPQAPRWLTWIIPGEYRDELLGDLQEEYQRLRLPDLGEVAARKWFRREFLRCLRTNVRVRLLSGIRRGAAPTPDSGPQKRRGSLTESVIQDLNFAFRSLRRTPSFTIVAVLTLSVGIGACTAIFSVLDGVMLKPMGFQEPHRLVVPWETFRTRGMETGTVSYPNLEDWESRNRVFQDLAGMHPEPYTLTGMGIPERIQGARVTADFFHVLGIRQDRGRLFLPEDDEEGASNVAVVSAGFWGRHFGGGALEGDQSVILNNRPHTIVGVLQPDFDFPFLVAGAEVWTPAALDYVSYHHREWPRLFPLARLREGVRVADAQADMERVAGELEVLYPETNQEHGANVVSLSQVVSASVSRQLILIFSAVGLVLLVACVNVANLLLARGMDRQRELGVRSALGAGRWRVIRQLLTEGLLLSVVGGTLGLFLAWAGTHSLMGLLPPGYPRVGEIGMDGRTLVFAAAASIVTCLVATLFPAIQTARPNIHAALKEGGRTSSAGRQRRIRQTLVVSEVALAVVILVGAGLLVRSFQQMYAVDPGFQHENVLTFRVSKGWSEMQVHDRAQFYSDASRELSSVPGVVAAGAGSILPVAGRFYATFQHDGEPELPMGERPGARYVSATRSYFETLEIPLLRGEMFTNQATRDSPGVMLVNEAAAREFWPDEDPVGQLVRPDVDITDADPTLFEVIGVVGSVRDQGLDAEPSSTFYVPHTQQTWPAMYFAVRTEKDGAPLIPEIREVINALSQEASFSFNSLEEVMADSVQERRFITLVIGVFAALALSLAGVGVFGVLSYSVTQRTRELGLRRALGADRSSVFALVSSESAVLLALGTGLGLALSLVATRLVSSFLFGVGATDLRTYLASVLLLVVSGALASYVPARRATRIDPMVALEQE